jgi:hypothetical protein
MPMRALRQAERAHRLCKPVHRGCQFGIGLPPLAETQGVRRGVARGARFQEFVYELRHGSNMSVIGESFVV